MKKTHKYTNPISKKVQKLSKELDEATINKDVKRVARLLKDAKRLLESENSISQASIYYSMGTAYSDFPELVMASNEEAIKKGFFYFRKSISLIDAEEYDKKYRPYVLGLKLVLYTNYANLLDSCGRKIAAIEQYKKAISINDVFGMANGNLGRSYQHYGMLEYDDTHRDLFHYYAYQYLNKGINCDDPNTDEIAKKSFRESIDIYDPEYIKNILNVELSFKQLVEYDSDELAYRKWCLKKGLFLNTLIDLPKTNLLFARDVLQLPKMILGIHTKPIFHGMFNQLKQEYIYARYIYYSTLMPESEPHYADKETYITAYIDYAHYSIRLEKLKTVFKTLYGMFDKISFFLEHYFDLGIKERDINFRSIWQSYAGFGKNKYQYKNMLDPSRNFALSSLYWISKDFFEKFETSPNPELKRIKDIRDALEHKYVKIYDSFFENEIEIEKYGDGLALYVSVGELYDVTFILLKILREAMINLSLCVNIAEIPKREASKDKLILPMSLMDYEDDWKT